jgi:Scramblase
MLNSTPQKETMDRGTEAMRNHLSSCRVMDIRQTRRGWLQDCLGCEAKSEFKYFIDNTQMAHSLEQSNCINRICFHACYSWTTEVKDLNTDAELLRVDRPCQCGIGGCKCCCYQSAIVTSGGERLGRVTETCYYCVPSFNMYDDRDQHVYIIHPPTCLCGVCVNCCAEGNPCGPTGCCKVPFWIFPSDQKQTDGSVPRVGKILKKPKSMMTELLTEANAFEVEFPEDATTSQKATLIGTALFFNSIFFEDSQS